MSPGSTLWLLRHELRLDLRRMFAKKSSGIQIYPVSTGRRIFVLGLLVLFIHLVGWLMAVGLQKEADPLAFERLWLLAVCIALPFALHAAGTALFQRRDYELLGASPLPIARIFAVRLIYVLAASWLGLFVIIGSTADVGLLRGAPWALCFWLASIPLAAVLGSVCLAFGALLERTLGARRAEAIFHYLGVAVMLVLMLGFQVVGHDESGGERISGGLMQLQSVLGAFSPGRALRGEFPALAALSAAAVFCLAALYRLGPVALLSCARASHSSPRQLPQRARSFASPTLWSAWRKEWKLVLRTPKAVSDVLTQCASTTSGLLCSAYFASEGDGRWALLAGGIAMLAMVLVERLGHWGRMLEQAPDLLLAAPLSTRRLSMTKLGMAVLPAAALCGLGAASLLAVVPLSALILLILGPVLAASHGFFAFAQTPLAAVSGDFGGATRQLASSESVRLTCVVPLLVAMSLLASLLASQFIPWLLYVAAPLAVIYALIVYRAWRKACENGLFDR